jgi:hypothetical protein
MEPNDESSKPQVTKLNQSNTVPIRVHKDTARLIRRELAKLNKKDLGRRIKVDDFITKSISKITDDDRKTLQEQSLSNSDRLELLYREHSQGGGSLTREQFLGQILAATIEATKGGGNG